MFNSLIYLRGFGNSIGEDVPPGKSGSTATNLDDLSAIISSELHPMTPLFLMGHSMGCAIAFTYGSIGPENLVKHVRGWLGEAPDFGLPPDAPTRPSALKVAFLRVISLFAPDFPITVTLDEKLLSRDQANQRAYLEDPLVRHRWTLLGALQHLQRTGRLAKGRYKPIQRVQNVWIGHGTDDKCTSFDKSKEWFKSLQTTDKVFREYQGWRHNCIWPIFYHSSLVIIG